MHISCAMNTVKISFGQPEPPSGEFANGICKVKGPLEGTIIRSNCKTGTYKVLME